MISKNSNYNKELPIYRTDIKIMLEMLYSNAVEVAEKAMKLAEKTTKQIKGIVLTIRKMLPVNY